MKKSNAVDNNNYYYIFRGEFFKILALSSSISLLMLAPSVYMLQVYSRVIDSNSMETLVWLTIMVAIVYAAMGLLERLREKVLVSVKDRFNLENRSEVIDCAIEYTLKKKINIISNALDDHDLVKEAINSNLTKAVYELPFSIVIIFILFYVSFFVGVLSVIVAIIMVLMGAIHYKLAEKNHENSAEGVFEQNKLIDNMNQPFEASKAMGVFNVIKRKFIISYKDYLNVISLGERISVANEVASKFVQVLFTSLLIGLCAFLFLENSLTGGSAMIIVASILGGRMIAPLVQITSGLGQIKKVHLAQKRINKLKSDYPRFVSAIKLPDPVGFLTVDNLFFADENTGKTILSGIDLSLAPGDILAVIGPSGSGKSTLAKLLVGAMPPTSGRITLDGVDIHKWEKKYLGKHIGYLPQEISIMDGSIASNISRFSVLDEEEKRSIQDVVDLCGLSYFFKNNKDFLSIEISSEVDLISGGQKQIVGVARAFYKKPKFIVLDEPNSNLDRQGELMLNKALKELAKLGSTIVVVTHRKNLIDVANKALVLQDGNQVAFDKKEAIINE